MGRIGRACTIRMAEEGAAIAVFNVLDSEGEALAAELTGRGVQSHCWHVDVGSEANVHSATLMHNTER